MNLWFKIINLKYSLNKFWSFDYFFQNTIVSIILINLYYYIAKPRKKSYIVIFHWVMPVYKPGFFNTPSKIYDDFPQYAI